MKNVTTKRVLSDTCDGCKEKKRFQKMYFVTEGVLCFKFCKECAHSSGEALKIFEDIILSSRPKAPSVPER